ncbi:MAG TPA: DUF4157 domain-containing protein [Gemmatimonadaceae bacterium]|jgi:hypothetical protein|nr:DUF4157 domain-containing protein [Gemmatimonadaceae bacterium]
MDDPGADDGVSRAREDGAAWRLLRALASAIVGRATRLPESLLDGYPELGEARWRRGGLPPRIGGWFLGRPSVAAITLGRTIFLAPGAPLAPELLLHELRHVHQFAADRAFPLRYVWGSLRHGYARNPYETDACRFAASRTSGVPPTA